jgi:uncharacterized delta-60 repeat protein
MDMLSSCLRRQLRIIGILVLALHVVPSRVDAQDQALDPTFDGDGRATTDFFGGPEAASDVLVQPDGKIVAAGAARHPLTGRFVFALARYLTDGSLDPSFGNAGKIGIDVFGSSAAIAAVAGAPDGKIVAAGAAMLGTSRALALARYTESGVLDDTFGNGGKVIVNGFGGATALALQPDGKIVAADTFIGLVRLNSDGSLDATFGVGGKVVRGDTNFILEDLALQSDGRIVVAGTDSIIVGPDPTEPGSFIARGVFAIARFNVDGSVDATFGDGGKTRTDVSTDFASARAVVVQSDDKVVAVGGIGGDFGLVRYHPNGSLDVSYGNAGIVTTDFAASGDIALAAAVDPDDRVVAAGWAIIESSSNDFGVARYQSDGSLDETFGQRGIAVTDFLNNTADIAQAVAIAPDQKIVAVGVTNLGDFPTDTFAIARYVTAVSTEDALRNLLLEVSNLTFSGVLNRGQSRALTATLNAVVKQLDAGRVRSVVKTLHAFINQVTAFVNSRRLSPAQGERLMDHAREILNRL